MSRSKWSVVFASLTALGLLFCQNMARGEESETAPQPPDAGSSAPAQKCDVAKDAACCVPQSCCGECCNNRHWIVDVDAVFLAPIQNQNFGAVGLGTGFHADPNGRFHFDNVSEAFGTANDGDFTVSPRVALGVQGECWGFLVRYWQLENCDVDAHFAPVTGAGIQSSSAFEAKTLDLEVTKLLGACGDEGWVFQASGGVRYAELHQSANLALSETTGVNSFYQDSVFARHDFNGAGVTFGLQGLRPVRCSNFNLFFDARVSWLFDSNAGNDVATHADWVSATAAHENGETLTTSDANLFIGEIQVGGQWDLPLKCIPANAFVRVAFEYQYWCTNNGGVASNYSVAGSATGGPIGFATGTSSGDTHVNLVGFNIGTGLTW